MSKAQILSYDFTVASLVFLVVLIFIFSYFSYANAQIKQTRISNDMVKKLSYLSSLFSKTGTPIYWSPEHLIEIGLQDGHELNWTKLNYLNEIGYQKTAELIPVIPYKFYFYIKNENNQTLFEFGVLPQNAKNILIIDRFGILNQTFVNIRGIVWD